MSIELDAKLINYVEKFPFLYYKGATNYNNELQLANTWKKIGKDLKVSPEYCMNRWKYLRRRYTREPQIALPEKEWVLMRYLRFLEPFVHRRKPTNSRLLEDPSPAAFEQNSQCDMNEYQNRTEAFSRGEWENENHISSASESTTLPSWKLSNESFCQSLSNTLQTLSADQQVGCRIDILVVIEKYLSSISVGDGSNSTNFTPGNFHSRLDTLTSDVSKRFAEILGKINKRSISSFDEDWLLIFAVKKFFCSLLEIRGTNSELNEMLPTLVSPSQVVQESERPVVSAQKPVSMRRKSELSKTDGISKPQPSTIFDPQLATSEEIIIDLIKTESADCPPFHSPKSVSPNIQHLPESNRGSSSKSIHRVDVHPNSSQNFFNSNSESVSVTHVESPIKTVSSGTQFNSPRPLFQNLLNKLNSEPVSVTHGESPIKTVSSGTQFNSPGPLFQNLLNKLNSEPISVTHVESPIKTVSSGTQLNSSTPLFQNLLKTNIKNSNCIPPKPSLAVRRSDSAPAVTTNDVIRVQPPTNVKTSSNSTVSSGLSNFATHSHVLNFPANRSISERRTEEFEHAVHETLKNINSVDPTNGFMQDGDRFLCVFCDVWFPSELYRKAHTRAADHKSYTENYFLHCSRVKKTALPKLDKSLYAVHDGGLNCIKCKALILCRSTFESHMNCEKHKNQVKNQPSFVELETTMISSIDQVIVPIGSSNYCVLCNVKLFESPPAEHISSTRHQKEISLLKGIFKIDRHAYCSYCNEKFPQSALTQHVNKKNHALKISSHIIRGN